MRAGVLPKSLHVDEPSPHVDWSAGAVSLLTESRPWPESDRPRRAGVSSFGVSGTNAHVIIEQAPQDSSAVADGVWGWGVVPLVISGRSAAALAGQADRLAEFVQHRSELDIVDAGAALVNRSMFEHRAVVLDWDREAALTRLHALASSEPGQGVIRGQVNRAGKTVFLFPGQGSQWLGMGRELHETSPVFASAFDEAFDALNKHSDGSLRTIMWDEQRGDLIDTRYAQPALFALEVALFRLLEALDVRPDFVIGHSVGEIAAAHVTGRLTLEDAARLVVERGTTMATLPAGGAMVAVRASATDVAAFLRGRAEIAAINGPAAVVVAGDATDIDDTVRCCHEQGWKTHRLDVSHAFHSSMMDPILAELRDAIGDIDVSGSPIPLISNLTGQPAGADYGTADYWVQHARGTVQFWAGLQWLDSAGATRFVEVGPGRALAALVDQSLPNADVRTPTIVQSRLEPDAFLSALAKLWVVGVGVNWAQVFDGCAAGRIDLPTYAFQRQRYWLGSGPAGTGSADVTGCGLTGADHALLGAVVERPETGGVTLTGRLAVNTHPWLSDHGAGGVSVFPGAGFVELAIRAGDEVGCGVIEELALMAPLILSGGGTRIQVLVDAAGESGRHTFSIHSCDEGVGRSWVLHARGELVSEVAEGVNGLTAWPPEEAEEVDLGNVYEQLATRGYEYGPAFRGLRAAWRRADEVFAEIALPDDVQVDGFGIHPALLDSALHALGVALLDQDGPADGQVWLPFLWEGVALHAVGARAARVRLRRDTTPGSVSAELADGTGAPVLTVRSLTARPITDRQLAGWAAAASHDRLFDVVWSPMRAVLGDAAEAAVSWEQIKDAVDVSGPVVLEVDGTGGAVPERARAVATRVLDVV
ncbi:type I polyketide synthase, partial [Nocardia sp. NPDC005978]|uniref:type I polyketide synthase n=1 Tax=Nocardia sp. NPDC005978 TaxID=3156725 RepID=UPI0033B1D355